MLNIQTDQINYLFNSGNISRQMQIRDYILGYYNIKVEHLFSFKYISKGFNNQNDYLMNKKVHVYKKKE